MAFRDANSHALHRTPTYKHHRCVKDATRNLLASGASNGNIIFWDISSRDGRASQERVIAAHPRTVNRINWHPQEEGLLLSASQDTTVKLWDRRGRLYHCQATYNPRSESVRDVQWHPSQAHYFAAACENGSVHLWDRRKAAGPVLKIMGHNGLVLALEWHLVEPWVLATGARDRTVKVWDLSDQSVRGGGGGGGGGGAEGGAGNANNSASTTLKETYLINTVSAVNRIKWRPGHPEQLTTTSSVQGDNMIHLWNVRHPFLPLATFDGHEDVCGSITWLDTPCLPEHAPHPISPSSITDQQQQQQQPQQQTRSSRLFGSWGAAWGESFSRHSREEGEKDDGLGHYTEYLGVWQHLVSCGRDGRVILYSLARASRPRDAVTPAVVALSVRGEMLTSFERIDSSKEFIGIVQNELTRQAPGLFAVEEEGGEGGMGGAAAVGGSEGRGGEQDDEDMIPGMLSRQASTDGRISGLQSTPPHPHHYMHPSSSLSTVLPSVAASSSTFSTAQQQTAMHRAATAPSPSTTDRLRLVSSPSSVLDPGGAAEHAASKATAAAAAAAAAVVAAAAAGGDAAAAAAASPFWLPRFLYRMDWDETSLNAAATAEIIKHLGVVSPAAGDKKRSSKSSSKKNAKHLLACPSSSPASLPETPLHFADQIAHLAKGYVLQPRGCPLPLTTSWDCHRAREDLCQHNAEVARLGGQWRMAHVWEMLGVFLPGGQEEGGREGGEGYAEEKEGGFDFATGRGVWASSSGKEGVSSQTTASSSSSSSWCLQLLRRELLSSIVEELLEEGDVQNCVALFEVIVSTGGALTGETLPDLIESKPERVREIYLDYLELLQRLALWEAANELVACGDDKYIQQLYVSNTTMYAACANCRRPTGLGTAPASDPSSGSLSSSSSPWCGKCRALVSQCALCLQPVRGVYVWCPGCGHGGHVKHLQEWFATNKECPTGCGHKCHLAAGDEGEGGGERVRSRTMSSTG